MKLEKTQFKRLYGKDKQAVIQLGWFAISSVFFEDKLERRESYGRWYKISHTNLIHNKTYSVYRILRFAPQLSAGKERTAEIEIDYMAWLELNGRAEKVDDVLDLRIEKAKRWHWIVIGLFHPDPSHRLSHSIALLSLGLGMIALFATFL